MATLERYDGIENADEIIHSVQLKYARFEVVRHHGLSWFVRTIFPNGYYANATRDELDPANIAEAESQGYTGPDAVWRSLVEHELLHSLVAELLFERESAVLATESGLQHYPTWERYEEESIVLACQIWNTTGNVVRPLARNPVLKNRIIRILDSALGSKTGQPAWSRP